MKDVYTASILIVERETVNIQHYACRVVADTKYEAIGKCLVVAKRMFPNREAHVEVADLDIPPIDDPASTQVI